MRIPLLTHDQKFSQALDGSAASVRDILDAAAWAKMWSLRILETADLTLHQRQNLYDIRRATRAVAINRSALGLLWNVAPLATIEAAMWGPTHFKVAIVGQGSYPLPSEDHAHLMEERANHDGNLAQHRRKERRTLSTAFDLRDTMTAQALASEQLALATART